TGLAVQELADHRDEAVVLERGKRAHGRGNWTKGRAGEEGEEGLGASHLAGEQHRPDCNPKRAIMPSVSDPSDLSARDVLARYPTLRDDHLRYLEKWGRVRPGGAL